MSLIGVQIIILLLQQHAGREIGKQLFDYIFYLNKWKASILFVFVANEGNDKHK